MTSEVPPLFGMREIRFVDELRVVEKRVVDGEALDEAGPAHECLGGSAVTRKANDAAECAGEVVVAVVGGEDRIGTVDDDAARSGRSGRAGISAAAGIGDWLGDLRGRRIAVDASTTGGEQEREEAKNTQAGKPPPRRRPSRRRTKSTSVGHRALSLNRRPDGEAVRRAKLGQTRRLLLSRRRSLEFARRR